jgi:hypothetical protein
MSMAFHNGMEESFRLPYQAIVINTLDTIRRMIVFMVTELYGSKLPVNIY